MQVDTVSEQTYFPCCFESSQRKSLNHQSVPRRPNKRSYNVLKQAEEHTKTKLFLHSFLK